MCDTCVQSDFIYSQSLADPTPPNSFGFIKKHKYRSVTDHTEEDYASEKTKNASDSAVDTNK